MKKIFCAISILIVASLACSLFSSGQANQAKQSSFPESTATLTEGPRNQISEAPSSTEEVCQADKWEVEPVTTVSIPSHDQPDWVGTETPPNGWNIIFVNYMILNKSDFWGSVSINNLFPTIATEGGFVYNTAGMQGVWIRSDQQVPAPVTEIHRQTSPFGDGDMGSMVNQVMLYMTDYIPPNFGVAGTVVGYTSQWFGAPEGWTNFPYYSIFKVAATQKQLTLTLPDIKVECIQDGAKQEGMIKSQTFNLDSIKSDWQQNPISGSVPNLGSTIDFADIGSVTLTNVLLDSGTATVKFQFTNSNQGAETMGTLYAYIVDSYGYMHRFGGGQFSAGPAATVDGQDLYILIGVPNDDHNMKIVFWIEIRQGDTTFNSYRVFNLNQ